MLKKLLTLFLILLFAFSTYAYAEMGDKATLGGETSGVYDWRVDSSGNLLPGTTNTSDIGSSSLGVNDVYINGSLNFAPMTKVLVPYEYMVTGDTLTASDSGKTIMTYFDQSDAVLNFTLPAVTAGVQYTLAAGHTSYIQVIPYGTNQIMYSTCSAGQKLLSAGASADSVTLISDGTRWYVTQMHGTWTDNN